MKDWVGIAGILLLALVVTVLAQAAGPAVKSLPATGNLFGEPVRSKLAGLYLEYRDAIWPSEAEFEKRVDAARVPAAVTEKAGTWVKTILKEELVPSDLKDRFIPLTRTFPFIPPDDVDCLLVRYQIGDTQVQIQDTGAYISILLNPLGTPRAADVPEYIKLGAGKFLNLPPEILAKGELKLKSAALSDGGQLWYGTMDYKFEPMMPNRAWWNHSYLWSDGKFFCYHTSERTGTEQVDNTQVNPGIRRRFLP